MSIILLGVPEKTRVSKEDPYTPHPDQGLSQSTFRALGGKGKIWDALSAAKLVPPALFSNLGNYVSQNNLPMVVDVHKAQ